MRIHFIGICGVSMGFLATLCKNAGITVSGSDLTMDGHDAKNVIGADYVVYNSAISESNVEYIEAKRRGIPLVTRAELLGVISHLYERVVAISGTHGKTTTAAMMSETLKKLNPTCHVGGSVRGTFGKVGDKGLFITEACEYKENFLSLSPDYLIVLNVDLDHADYYKTYDNFYAAFSKMAAKSRVAFVCGDNNAATLKGRELTYTFGLEPTNDYYAQIKKQTNGYYTFKAYFRGEIIGKATLGVRGKHNVVNAMAVIAYCHHTQTDFGAISQFFGVDRRFETLATIDGIEYISDYAHHPDEIDCALKTAKELFGKVLTVFEPHTYSRTEAFYKQFARSLLKSDECILLPVFAAREKERDGISSVLIAKEGKFLVANSYRHAKKMILDKEKNFDCVLFMGAGTVDNFARKFVIDKQTK